MGFFARLHIGFAVISWDEEKVTQAIFPEHDEPSLRELDFDGSWEAWEEVILKLRPLGDELKASPPSCPRAPLPLADLQMTYLVDNTQFISLKSVNPWEQSSFQVDDFKDELCLLARKAADLGIKLEDKPSIGIHWYKG